MAIIALPPRMTRPLLSLGLLLAFGLPGIAVRSFAAVATPQIIGPIQNQQRVTLRGNVRPMSARAHDMGAVTPDLPSGRVQLLLRRPQEQEVALAQFLEDVQRPGSAAYHKWMTPGEIGNQFGPSTSDVQAVVGWLQSQGFIVARVNQARTAIEFSGTAGQIQHTFSTQMHSFSVDGETHVSNITDPQIPAALAPVVVGISPLNDFRLKPMHTPPTVHVAEPAPTTANPHAFSVRPANAALRPELTRPPSGGNPEQYFITPGDLATIYNTPNSTFNTRYAASASLDGGGVNVGIAGVSNVDMSSVSSYRQLFGIASVLPSVTIDGNDPGVQGDNAVEALLDLEQVSAVAPGANITLYIAQDTTFQQGLFLAIQRALDENAVSILNVSFGGCEAYQTQAGNQQVLNFWQQAAAQGISVTVSSGDSNSAACDSANATSAAQGLQVNALASTPYNIAVGGTDFNQTTATASQFWSATNSSIFESALGPIPEIPWNNSSSTFGPLAGNVVFQDSRGNTRIDGAGGGVSGCLNATVDNNTGNVLSCSGAYAQPSFQSGFGTGNARRLPDVSLFSANGGHQAAYLLCASGLGGDRPGDIDCVRNGTNAISFQAVGGTSASSPVFAGVLALVSQSLGSGVRLGQADFTLYPLSRQHANAFHDVTTGNISPVCAAGTPNCGANGFLTGYDATTGYDPATGLGSLDVTQLVQNWNSVTFQQTTTALQLNGSTGNLNITHGTAVNVSTTVTASGGTPTGSVALINGVGTGGPAVAAVQGTTASPSLFTLSNGSATGPYAYLPGGSYAVTANYEGDGVFGRSTSNPINVNVSPEASTLALSVIDFTIANNGAGSNASGGSFPYGSYISVSALPIAASKANLTTPQPLATGSITFAGNSTLLNQSDIINSNGYAEIANQLNLAYPPGAYSVSASYSGDASFTSSTAALLAFTVTKADTFSTLAAFPASGTGSLTVEVDPNNQQYFVTGGASVPSGTVTVTNASGGPVGTGPLARVTLSDGSSVAQATIAVAQGGSQLGISYTGDGNYNAPTSIICTLGQFALCAPSGGLTVSRGASSTAPVSITPQSGFTGTVNVSCTVSRGSGQSPTCSLAQPSVSLNGGPVVDVLTVTASNSAGLHIPAAPQTRPWRAVGGVALAGLLLLGVPRRRRAWQRMLSLLVVVLALGFAGCGGGGSKSGGTPPGSYVVTITATSGSATSTSTVNVTVQ